MMTKPSKNRSLVQPRTACLGFLKQPRMLRLTLLICWLLTMARPVLAPAQGTSSAPSSATTSMTQPGLVLKAQSRLVVVDVTVKARGGRFVQDLKQSDFKVFENGKPQRIVAFERHEFNPQAAAAAALQLPKGEYSNIGIRAASVPALNIILFDALNSEMADQIYGRQQMVQFLKTLPPGQPTALFVLGDKLKVLAGFSTNSDQLRAAAEKLMPHSSRFYVSEWEAEQDLAFHNASAPAMTGPLAGDALESFIENARSSGEGARIPLTLAAFRTLAHIVAGYPGRKNILWLSEGFTLSSELHAVASWMKRELVSERVVVYPIDIRGLAATQVGASTPDWAVSGREAVGTLTDTNGMRLTLSQEILREFAKDTGGKAFYNTNDLKNAFQRAIEDGSNFYTLAYVPSDRNWNGAYRQIKVEMVRGGLDLGYRRGYYATERHPSPAQLEQEFESAMRPGIPDSTVLPFKIAVTPPGSAPSELSISYDIQAENIAFQDSAGGRKLAHIKFVAVAYGKDGKSDSVASQLGTLDLKPDTYNKTLKSGIRFHQQLRIQPGDNDLRVGVLDEGAGTYGTLDVPLPPAEF